MQFAINIKYPTWLAISPAIWYNITIIKVIKIKITINKNFRGEGMRYA